MCLKYVKCYIHRENGKIENGVRIDCIWRGVLRVVCMSMLCSFTHVAHIIF